MEAMKPTRHLERIVKGFSNHRRIEIMHLLSRAPELSLSEIAEALKINFKTINSEVKIPKYFFHLFLKRGKSIVKRCRS